MPGAVLVTIDNGHSALDTHPGAALEVIERLRDRRLAGLADEGDSIGRLKPGRDYSRRIAAAVSALLVVDAALAALLSATRPSVETLRTIFVCRARSVFPLRRG